MKIRIKNAWKSIPMGQEYEIPDFCIITGKNGSGKTHLLEAIENGGVSDVFFGEVVTTKRNYFPVNSLVPTVDPGANSMQIKESVEAWVSSVKSFKPEMLHLNGRASFGNMARNVEPLKTALISEIIRKINDDKKIDVCDITSNDLLRYLDFSLIYSDKPFSSKLSVIFKSYIYKKQKNEFDHFLSWKYPERKNSFFSESEFLSKYGQPPWDVVNSVFEKANFQFSVVLPEADDLDVAYGFRLISNLEKTEINVNDLSSGEKVIMALALALYNYQVGSRDVDLLLLDEPDASLHPEFSKILVDVINDILVKKSGIKVIITTHSPTTVAMAPEGSVFELDKNTKCLKPLTNNDAIDLLKGGLGYLKVSYDNRRHIFVESKYDVMYFERLHRVLRKKYNFSFTPTFLAASSREGSNCDDVIAIVDKLRDTPYNLAFGIIDYDLKNLTKPPLYVLGGNVRYAIENYILDPIYVILTLVHEGKNKFSEFGVEGRDFCSEIKDFSTEELQTLIDGFLSKIELSIGATQTCTLQCGVAINYPLKFLHHQGHEYEKKIMNCFIGLNSIVRGKGEHELKLGVLKMIESYPEFLASDLVSTFIEILGVTDC